MSRLDETDAFRTRVESMEVLQALATSPDPSIALQAAKQSLQDAAQPVRDLMNKQPPLVKEMVEVS